MSDISQLEISIEQARNMVALRDAVVKLSTNREFKKVFIEDYFKAEAIRLVDLSADPIITEDQKADVLVSMHGISVLKQYLRRLTQMGDIAEQEIKDAREEIDHIREEED